MSDGYQVYRKYLNRARCWAHLIRISELLALGGKYIQLMRIFKLRRQNG